MSETSSDDPVVPPADAMTGEVEAAIRSDLAEGWPGARLLDGRSNVGFSDGKSTSHAFRIRADDATFELVVGPRAVRSGDADGVIRALREEGWIGRIRKERRLLVEKEDGGFRVAPRPDDIVL